ncbi:hypothetical protein F5883DRAFT_584807 [Diaporthe sp. PMI_573]|nr:hypothetical protein F5883DRAFT_584807 [Diaporthaceae sp. PMI_573]
MHLSVDAAVQAISEAIGHLTSTFSDELLRFAQGNITQHVTALLSTQNEQSIVGTVGLMADYFKLSVAAKTAAEHCAGFAVANLTGIVDILRDNPLDYVPKTYDGIKYCLHEEASKNWFDAGWLLLFALLFIVMAVLFGPYWPVLLPLRIVGFGALGPIDGSIAAMLQSVLYGGFTPGGGWFAFLQRWGMNL